MTVDNASTIDGMGFDPDSGGFVLRVYDHLDWEDVAGHLNLIVAKVTGYVTFWQSGQAEEQYPEQPADAFAHPLISLSLRVPPTEHALQGLGQIAGQLSGIGARLGYTTGDGADAQSVVFGG